MSDKIDNSEIMKGLEDFLDQELLDTSIGADPSADPVPVAKKPAARLQEPIVETKRPAKKPAKKAATIQEPIGFEAEQVQYRRKSVEPVREPERRKRSLTGDEADELELAEMELQDAYDKAYKKERAKQAKKMAKKSADRATKKSVKQASKRDIKKEAKKNARRDAEKSAAKNAPKKSHGFRNFILFLFVVFMLLAGALYMMVGSAYRNMKYEEIESRTREPMKEDGVVNILLIGNDSRQAGEDGRSDAMILLSISDNAKSITMTSLLRDMYVEIPGHGGNRLNAAYAYGGPELLMETLEQNLGIKVHRYMLVNFQAFANLVEAVGGVDLELSNEEVQWVNAYLNEYNELEGNEFGTYYLDASLSGMVHLNGPQALAYSRNRYIGTDFGRTERQRKVLNEVMKKLPMTVLTNYKELETGLFPNLTTNLKQNECYNLTLNAWKFLSYESGQLVVPADGTYQNVTISGMAVMQVDFDENKRLIKEALY
ncbi:MAG: LCP family protein [Lachnospiraceae bacterium]|nr:LCP family protein [Lachnospiraceae bacterium]